MPVELIAFSASVSGYFILLSWTTATELNNYGFEIQKKYNNEFKTVGFVKGSGSSVEKQQYYFTDKNSLQGINTYRLKQIDFDGKFNYSQEIWINFNKPEISGLSQNFPNPFNPATFINFSLAGEGNVTLSVFNMLGERAVLLLDNEFREAGNYSIRFSAENLASGSYVYILRHGDKILSKKMILMK